jgi:hypothetical protein
MTRWRVSRQPVPQAAAAETVAPNRPTGAPAAVARVAELRPQRDAVPGYCRGQLAPRGQGLWSARNPMGRFLQRNPDLARQRKDSHCSVRSTLAEWRAWRDSSLAWSCVNASITKLLPRSWPGAGLDCATRQACSGTARKCSVSTLRAPPTICGVHVCCCFSASATTRPGRRGSTFTCSGSCRQRPPATLVGPSA